MSARTELRRLEAAFAEADAARVAATELLAAAEADVASVDDLEAAAALGEADPVELERRRVDADERVAAAGSEIVRRQVALVGLAARVEEGRLACEREELDELAAPLPALVERREVSLGNHAWLAHVPERLHAAVHAEAARLYEQWKQGQIATDERNREAWIAATGQEPPGRPMEEQFANLEQAAEEVRASG